MATQLYRNAPSEGAPRALRPGGSRAPRRDTRTERDGLVQVARQTLVQMRTRRRDATWIARPRSGTRA